MKSNKNVWQDTSWPGRRILYNGITCTKNKWDRKVVMCKMIIGIFSILLFVGILIFIDFHPTSSEKIIMRSPDGHFYLNAKVDGMSMRFLIDTGATITAISSADAVRIGYIPNQLNYWYPVSTANGEVLVAPIEIETLQIGDFRIISMDAMVHPPETLLENLLGMDVISEFQSWRIEGDRLVLVP